MNPETLAWARAKFTFEVEGFGGNFIIAFIERDSHCVLDFCTSTATSKKQLDYDINTFLLELEKVL